MATAQLQTQISELYVAFFNRAPDAAGFQYWLAQLDAGNITLQQMKSNWWNSQPETANMYPSHMLLATFVDAIYNNVLGRAADEGGKTFWVEALRAGSVTREDFIQNIIDATKTPSGIGHDTAYLTNRAEVGVYFAQHGVHNGEQAINIMKVVTSDAFSVIGAKALIDGTATTIGTLVNGGYISGATVFIDSDFDNVRDTGEITAITDSTGRFTITGGIGQLVAFGGTDVITDSPNKVVFTGIVSSGVVSPVSAVIAKGVAGGTSVAIVEMNVQNALGIAGDIDLNTANPLGVIILSSSTSAEKLAALKLQASDVQINNIFSTAVSMMEGAGETMSDAKRASIVSNAAGTIVDAMMNAAATGVAFDLSNATFIKSVFIGVASEASNSVIASYMNTNAQSIATLISEYNTRIDVYVSSATVATIQAVLIQIGKIQEVVQDSLGDALSNGLNAATLT